MAAATSSRGRLTSTALPCLPSRRRRVLVISHGHPAYTRGGAEIAAHGLFQALREQPDCEAWFLGCRPGASVKRLGVAITQPSGENDYVYVPGAFDWFKFANRDAAFPAAFTQLLTELQPDVVHFHHFAHVGVEALALVRQSLPGARIVLTVHEYLMICHAFGQMVTRQEQNLCHRATLDACHACFPDINPSDFFLRAAYIRRFLCAVDTFVAPSHFLAGRLIDWGIPAERLSVIENLIVPASSHVQARVTRPGAPLRVGFFGQISRLKGVAVLLAAAKQLDSDGENIVFDIHGEYRSQPPEFQDEFLRLLALAGKTVSYHGAYRPQDVDSLMQGSDLVVVPSIWWENSPVVIQEALRNRRPLVCSDLGGMTEKVREGIDGWRFPVGSTFGLAALLAELAADRPRIAAMSALLSRPPTVETIVQAHRDLYDMVSTTTARA